MTSKFSGKVALITGGSRGIGRAVATMLVQEGGNVAVNYSSDTSAADSLAKELGSDRCLTIQADAGSIAGCEMMVQETVKRFGKIDILIPAAAVLPMKALESTSEDEFDRAYTVNVKGPYFLVQKAVPHMPPGSHIVLFSTSLTRNSAILPMYLLYVSTKGAIEQMLRVLAKDLATKGICVNAIAPGPTATDGFYQGKTEELVQRIAAQSPFNKIGETQDIASATLFLCGESSKWVSGQLLMVNGAMC